MSKIDELIEQLCPNGIQYEQLGENCEVLRGKRLTKKELHEDGTFPVFHGGLIPLGRYDKFNRLANQTMVINTGSVGEVVWSSVDFWSSDGTFVIKTSESINDRFLYYFLKTQESYLKTQKREGGVPTIDRQTVENLSIPIPPLAIQEEIVSILDTFTTLEAELEEELEARKKQYTYYRDSLLSFEGKDVEWKMLGEVGEFVRGNGLQKKDFTKSGVGCIHYGQIYTYYGTYADKTKSFVSPELAKKLKKASKNDLVIAGVSENVEDVCKAVVWLGDEDICISGDAFIYKHKQNPKFIGYLFQTSMFLEFKKKFAQGAKVTRLQSGSLPKYLIPIPPIEEQERIANSLDKLDTLINNISIGLPAEIKSRRKQYEYYRNQLLTFNSVSNE